MSAPEGVLDPLEEHEPERRPGELTARELVRFAWRQLTSMRTALALLLLLALVAVPGSLIPQEGVDSLKTSQWKDAHPSLTPVYERLGLFDVYGSPWFAAVYLLLMVSLVGCIVPRCRVYWTAMRAAPPAAPRTLTRLPDHVVLRTTASPEEVLAAARAELARRRYRLRAADLDGPDGPGADAVSAERGRLREAGNLLFHLSVIVVLVGFAVGSLFGYKGGVILVQGSTFSNVLTQYDDFNPGSLFDPEQLDGFASLRLDSFRAEWVSAYQARDFHAGLTWTDRAGGPEQTYDLRVNHPLDVEGTSVFLIGHGYAPVVTIRDGEGLVVYSGPTIFLPVDQTFQSFGVVKAPDAQPEGIGLQGLLYPTFAMSTQGDPVSATGQALAPLLSVLVYTGDLGMDEGASQSVYTLDTSRATKLTKPDGKDLRLDLAVGQTEQLPDGLGSVTFDGVQEWTRLQISRTPGIWVALGGVVLALIGLLGSLFVRPRRVWVRARRVTPGEDDDPAAGTLVEVAGLDRSGGDDLPQVLDDIVRALPGGTRGEGTA